MKHWHRSIIAGIALALVATLSLETIGGEAAEAEDASTPTVAAGTVPGEAILLFEDAVDAGRVLASIEESPAMDAELVAEDLAGKSIVVVDCERESQVDELIGAADALPGVEAQPNYVYELLDDGLGSSDTPFEDAGSPSEGTASSILALPANYPNDPKFDEQYYLDPLGDGTGPSGANVARAWGLARDRGDRASVTVAIVDTGVNLTHEDLRQCVDTEFAYNVVTQSDQLLDELDHGTLVAGIIGASPNNSLGITGVASGAEPAKSTEGADPLVKVLPIDVFENGRSNTGYLIRAFDYLDGLVENGSVDDLKVINLSVGFYAADLKSPSGDVAFKRAIDHMHDAHGVLCVCSGGNEARTDALYPSDYESCLSVTALGRTGGNANFSDYNLQKDIAAPGVAIYSTSKAASNAYTQRNGTSFSAPIVSGVAALMYSVCDGLTPAEAAELLCRTAAPLPNPHVYDRGEATGCAGALDAGAAVAAAIELAESKTPTDPSTTEPEPSEPSEPEGIAVLRLYNEWSHEHFLTTDTNERDQLVDLGWRDEGRAWTEPTDGAPIYRLHNPWNGDHLYTTDLVEYTQLGHAGWLREGVKMHGAGIDGIQIHRLWNPWMTEHDGAFSHLWTADANEYRELVAAGWRDESVAWYAIG